MQPLKGNLRSHVDVLAGLIGERNSRRPSALDTARAYIARQLGEMGLQVSEYRYSIPMREAVNLEVTIPGTRPDLPYLIVGAHYDTAPTTPGADDKIDEDALTSGLSNLQMTCAARQL